MILQVEGGGERIGGWISGWGVEVSSVLLSGGLVDRQID